MSRTNTKINYNEMTVEDGGILYTMEDLARLSFIYERLCTAEYLEENDERLAGDMETAYNVACSIRDHMEDYCTCESEIITEWGDHYILDELGLLDEDKEE